MEVCLEAFFGSFFGSFFVVFLVFLLNNIHALYDQGKTLLHEPIHNLISLVGYSSFNLRNILFNRCYILVYMFYILFDLFYYNLVA